MKFLATPRDPFSTTKKCVYEEQPEGGGGRGGVIYSWSVPRVEGKSDVDVDLASN